MSFFYRSAIFLPILLSFAIAPSTYANITKQLKSEDLSDPGHVAHMQEGFLEQLLKYDDKVANDIEVVISPGQQTYPALHTAIEEIANNNDIKINIQRGSCGVTSKKLLDKLVDVGTFCCPPGNTVYHTYNLTTWTNENNRNKKAEFMINAIYDYIQKHGEEYGFVPAEKLKAADWKFKETELIAEPDGQTIVSQR